MGVALVASLLRIALNPAWGTSFPYIFFFPTTLFTALYGGIGPAWAGIAVCAVMTFVWILPPTGVMLFSDNVNLVGLAVYIMADGIVAWIGAEHRALIAEGERQRIALAEREESLSRAETAARRLAAIVESSEDAIIAKTVNGIITAWNSGATRIFGHHEREAIGQSIDLIVPSDRRAEEVDLRRRVVQGEAVTTLDTVRVNKDGEPIDVAISVSPIRDVTGSIIGASTIARDIRVRRRVEAERAALLSEAESARAEAEDANRAKDDFLAILGHELRNPLATIVAGVRVLRRIGSTDRQVNRIRDSIEGQAGHLSRLVDDLLDVKRILRGDFALERHPCDLADVTSAVITTLKQSGMFKDRSIVIETETAWVRGDVGRLQQIVTNLLDNAAKYTPIGGTIRVSVASIRDAAVLRVQDSGIGIRSDLLPRLFELFVQGKSTPARGLGIGLAVVRRLVELHDGTVDVWSDGAGKGSMFTVKLSSIPAPSDSDSRRRRRAK
jgi:PAS domain S-box-containing protein